MRKDKNRYINEQCALIEQNSITNTTKDLYQGVKNLTRKFKALVDTIKDKEGLIICEGEKVRDRWKEYCEDLYSRNEAVAAPIFHMNNIGDEPPHS